MTWNRQVIAASIPVAAVAIIAGVVSYGHIEALALSVHQTISAARLLPFAVDLLIVAGSVIVLAGYWLGWLGVVVGVAGTLFANVESGLPFGLLAATVAAWPAVAFTVASFILERWLNRQVSGTRPLVTGGQSDALTELCAHDLTGPAEQVVISAYLHGRDCLGQPPSQRSLAATFGVHRTKVAALVGPLNGRPHEDDHPGGDRTA